MADTSGLLAAYDTTDPLHDKAAWTLNSAGVVVMSPLVLAELDHLSRKDPIRILPKDADRMMGELQQRLVSKRLVIPEITAECFGRAQLLRRRFTDFDLDLADATTMVLAVEWSTYSVLTLDERDFRGVTPPDGGYFEVLPADM
jgi:predicted nucleic acid-binding protein